MKCIQCGAELREGAKFCTKCGTRQPELPSERPVQQAVEPSERPVQQIVEPSERPAQQAAVQPVPPVAPEAELETEKAETAAKAKKPKKKKKTGLIILLSLLGALIVAGAVLVLTGVIDVDKLLHGDKKASEPEQTETAKEEGETADAPEIKLGIILLYDETNPYDANTITAAKTACEKAGVPYELRMNVATGDACYEAAKELANSGCTVVFANRINYEDAMLRAAADFPDVQFCNAGGGTETDNPPANFHYARAAVYEGEYIAGVAAGMKLNAMQQNGDIKKPKLGFVSPFPYDEMVQSYSAFFVGAQSVCPDVKMDVAEVGSWFSEESERELATAMEKSGCAIIARMTDSTSVPAFCESKGLASVNWNNAASGSAPKTGLVYVAINWQPYIEYLIDCAANGKQPDAEWTGHLKDGTVVVGGLTAEFAAPGTADKLDELTVSISSGDLNVLERVNALDPNDFKDEETASANSGTSTPPRGSGIHTMD